MTTKRALLVAIDRYQHAYITPLDGCVNDSKLFQNVLEKKFNFEHITVLHNEAATRSAILAAFDTLAEETEPNDIVVFHYSGHGSQIVDQEGDEPDGLDETIVTYDSGRTYHNDKNRDITDDEIANFIRKLNEKTHYVTLVVDSCHSGTITRDPFGDKERWVEADDFDINDAANAHRLSLLPPPVVGDFRGIEGEPGESGWLPKSKKYVLLAGCRDEEKSYEFLEGSMKYGVFTYHLCVELQKAAPDTSYRTVFERASAMVTGRKSQQHPQMEGERNRELFGEATIETMRYLKVSERRGKQVTLAGGLAHGLRVGSRWAIYAPEVNEVSDETPRLGLVEIEKVRGVSADSIILFKDSKMPDAISAGCRAVVDAHNYGEMELRVELDAKYDRYPDQVHILEKMISESHLVSLLETSAETADCRLYLLPPRDELGPKNKAIVPDLQDFTEPTWAIVTDDGLTQFSCPAWQSDAIWQVMDRLEKLARFRIAWGIRNEAANNPLADTVDVIVKRRPQSEIGWEKYPIDAPVPVFYEGDRLAMTIRNTGSQPVFVTVLNFGVSGAVYQVHPIEGASEQLVPDNEVSFGIADDDVIDVFLPKNFD